MRATVDQRNSPDSKKMSVRRLSILTRTMPDQHAKWMEDVRFVSGWSRRCPASEPGLHKSFIRTGPDVDEVPLTVRDALKQRKEREMQRLNAQETALETEI